MSRDRPQKPTAVWPGVVHMSARALTAFLGGYAAAAALCALLARLLPGSPEEASAWGMILSFLLFAGLGLWAFHERRLVLVASVLWGAALLAGGAMMLLGTRP